MVLAFEVATETGQATKAGEFQWATNTCMHRLLYDSALKEPESTCSQLSNDRRLLVVGMTSGCVELYIFDVSSGFWQNSQIYLFI
jgi:hypothetical protein